MSDQTDAWNKVAGDEAQALAELLNDGDSGVLVIIVRADPGDGETRLRLLHRVAGNTHKMQVEGFIEGVERKLAWMRKKLHGHDG